MYKTLLLVLHEIRGELTVLPTSMFDLLLLFDLACPAFTKCDVFVVDVLVDDRGESVAIVLLTFRIDGVATDDPDRGGR